jgi:serine/tyrosine/threonine adenylyltransferase
MTCELPARFKLQARPASRPADERLQQLEVRELIRRVNPAFIPRNHRVEAALEAASTHGDFGPFLKLLNILEHPYDDQPDHAEFEQPAAPAERVLRTYCGT